MRRSARRCRRRCGDVATDRRMLTADQLAALLGLSTDWVYERAAAGELPSYKLGASRRFRESEVEAWLQTQHSTPNGRRVASVHELRR
ncbi:MAG: helix-turn-helix domain-containing protein [Gaiellaceae bacterium]